jgi:glyoxylase-like metal-dependent hydrolase (beta-lactamase superfamily II)
VKIHQITIPTPFAVGDVNVYLIREEPLTLIDVGPKTATAAAVLRENLRKFGVKFSDVRRIVLTHAHEDHSGLAKTIRDEAKDAEIFVHEWENGHLFGRLQNENQRRFLARAGVPETVFLELQELYKQISQFTDKIKPEEFTALRDNSEIEFATGALRVLHTPGHTPGSCSLLREADRTAICGDCVLKRITPNPILSPDPLQPEKRFASLGEFLVSLARLRSVAPTLIYGGHGEPVTDFEEIFNRYVRAIDERQKTVLNLISAAGAMNAWETAQKLFPRAVEQKTQRFLAISETIAHLDYAVFEGKIGFETRNGVEFYRKL